MPYEKVGDQEPVCIADEVPFEIPETWEWVRLPEFVNYVFSFCAIYCTLSDRAISVRREVCAVSRINADHGQSPP